MTEEIHIDDVGTEFRFALVDQDGILNVASASSITISLRKPDLATDVWTAALETDGTDGIIVYNTIADDLDTPGWWKAQVIVIFPVGITFNAHLIE